MRVYNFEGRGGVILRRGDCTAARPEAPHHHKFVELVYVLSGSGVHYINGQAFPSARGDLLFIDCGEEHAIESAEQMDFFNLLIKPEQLFSAQTQEQGMGGILRLFSGDRRTPQLPAGRTVRLRGAERLEAERLFEQAYAEASSSHPGRAFVLGGYVRLILGLMLRAFAEPTPPAKKRLTKKQLGAYLEDCLGEPITVADMAAALGYHPAYLGRAFHGLFGMSVHEYLCRARMQRAADLLAEGGMTVSEVITACGYTNRTRFYRDFTALYHCSPGTYRPPNEKKTAEEKEAEEESPPEKP